MSTLVEVIGGAFMNFLKGGLFFLPLFTTIPNEWIQMKVWLLNGREIMWQLTTETESRE